MSGEQVEAVDHRAEAEKAIRGAWVATGRGQDKRRAPDLQLAQAHATLALVDEVAKANQDRREHRASAVEELRLLVTEALNGHSGWRARAMSSLAQFEAADRA